MSVEEFDFKKCKSVIKLVDRQIRDKRKHIEELEQLKCFLMRVMVKGLKE